MPLKKYRLSVDEPARLEISWKINWKDLKVTFDQKVIGKIPTKKELFAGKELALPNASTLKIQLVKIAGIPTLELLCNGKIIPGSETDPKQRFSTAAMIVYFLAAVNIVVGLLAQITDASFLRGLGAGGGTLVIGFVYLCLAYAIKKASLLALIVAIVLFLVDTILGLAAYTQVYEGSPVGIIVVRILLLMPMIQAFGASRRYKSLT